MACLPSSTGSPISPRAVRSDDLTPDAQREQGSAGLDATVGAGLLELNRAYRGCFGSPFIKTVKGRRAEDILTAPEARLRNPEPEERAEAVPDVERILLLRLKDCLGEV